MSELGVGEDQVEDGSELAGEYDSRRVVDRVPRERYEKKRCDRFSVESGAGEARNNLVPGYDSGETQPTNERDDDRSRLQQVFDVFFGEITRVGEEVTASGVCPSFADHAAGGQRSFVVV